MKKESKQKVLVDIQETRERTHNVVIWEKGEWLKVSNHKFKIHAEEIKGLLERGANRTKVEEKIKGQKIFGRAVITAPAYLRF